jgi:hypothetical protein
MKHLKLLSALILPLLAAPSVFATPSIPWHWDDEVHTVPQYAAPVVQEEEEEEEFTSDIGW